MLGYFLFFIWLQGSYKLTFWSNKYDWIEFVHIMHACAYIYIYIPTAGIYMYTLLVLLIRSYTYTYGASRDLATQSILSLGGSIYNRKMQIETKLSCTVYMYTSCYQLITVVESLNNELFKDISEY